ncbi:hypothetical protein SLEP1_g19404 [Rubroshorea leprosula]|nr:hypothetical protein SLEP1_g19404 [Rubroshorea leprosula]
MAPTNSLVFTVRRREPELIAPAKPTYREYKPLSDIDDQESLRFQLPVIHFYPYTPSMEGKDPVKVIREALAKALVFYHPFAGRLREGPDRKLIVDCTGEGIMFIEADADVTLEQFGDALQPPFPCFEELLYDVPGSSGVLNCPLMLIQVTRLKCGGFIFALRLNHTMSDASGLVQFLTAVSEMAHGESVPSVMPFWERHLFNARYPPRVTCTHHEYEGAANTEGTISPLHDIVQRSFFFGPSEISTVRSFLPHSLRQSSTFEVLTAFLWRFRTIALDIDPNKEMRAISIVNARSKFNPPISMGFYGNGFALSTALTTAGKLCQNPLAYALELVKQAKADITEEYMKSVADLMVIRGRPPFIMDGTFLVSDVTRAGLIDVDFGWGKAVYAGVAAIGGKLMPWVISFFMWFKNKRGEEGIVVPICLPTLAMDKFVMLLDNMLKEQPLRSNSRL